MLLTKDDIFLNESFDNWEEAIRRAGDVLVASGKAKEAYIEAMLERQKKVSVYIGNFVALPHGEKNDALILNEGICLLQVPDGVNFGSEEEPQIATLLFAVALKSNHQLEMLQELAFFCADIDNVLALSDAETVEEVMEILMD